VKKSDTKFKLFLGASFILTLCLTIYFQKDSSLNKKVEKEPPKTQKVAVNKTSAQKAHHVSQKKRKPASVKKKAIPRMRKAVSKNTNNKERVVIGKVSKNQKLHFSNHYNKNWLSLYEKNLKRMIRNDELSGLEIKKKKSVLKVKDGIARYLEHIVVNYDNGKSLPLSFEAYIDSQTGQMVQSWNQTHIEFKKPIKLQASNRRFRSK
tara:strand:+ start:1452 stop:2072 length:621 start_codon:yes stop_codon:yes gene_type:complete